MNPTHSTPAALAVLAIAVIGCGQQPGRPDRRRGTGHDASRRDVVDRPVPRRLAAPSATGSGESAMVVPGEFTICIPPTTRSASGPTSRSSSPTPTAT